MRIAALYDIHGNLPALEAVLDELRQAHVDQIVVGGDVFPGPMPRETLVCLLNAGFHVQFIYGNGDIAVLDEICGRESRVPDQYRPLMRWNAQQLEEHSDTISRWPKTLELEVPHMGRVLFCHGTPRSEDEIFTRLTSEDRLRPAFEGVRASLIVCGHTHMQFDRAVGDLRVINAGSVGMPFGAPGADWLLLGSDVQLRHTTYDVEGAAERMRETQCPNVEDVFLRNLLQPPSEAEMLAVYGGAEVNP